MNYYVMTLKKVCKRTISCLLRCIIFGSMRIQAVKMVVQEMELIANAGM